MAVVGVLLGALGGPPSRAASPAGTLPPQGVFESCPLDREPQDCDQRLQAMAAGGLQVVVLSAASGSLGSLSAYAADARQLGMSVMWAIGDPTWWRDPPTSTNAAAAFPAFAAGCGCDQNGPLLMYMIRWLAQLPATYGFYAADDSMLQPSDADRVKSYVREVKGLDPLRTVMVGAYGSEQQNSYESIADVIGAENYPVTTTTLMPASAHQAAWSAIAQWASETQQAADAADTQSAFILQAFTWGDNLDDGGAVGVCTPSDTQQSCYDKLTYPTPGDQLQLRNEVLLNAHPQVILWYSFPGTYGQAGNDTDSIYPTGQTAADRWAGLTDAIQAAYPMPPAQATPPAPAPPPKPQPSATPPAATVPVAGAPGHVAASHHHRRPRRATTAHRRASCAARRSGHRLRRCRRRTRSPSTRSA